MEVKKSVETKDLKVKVLVYGQAGAGKTSLCKSVAKSALLISAEGGLLSLSGTDIDNVEIKDFAELLEVYSMLKNGTDYKIICLDSISEIAEKVLSKEKEVAKDPRQAYGEMQDKVAMVVRAFRDLPYHVYMSCKAEMTKDENGSSIWGPAMPGQKLGQALPYLFDEVLALRVWKNEDGKTVRALQTEPDGIYTAKDRSGKLDKLESPDLMAIISKVKKGIEQKEDTK